MACVIICASWTMASCNSNKQVVSQQVPQYTNPFAGGTYELPCAIYDDEEYFAATGMASGPATQKGKLQLLALKNGQDLIAMKMQHAVQGEVKTFFESVGNNKGNDVDGQDIGEIDNIIMGIVNNTSHCCLQFSGVDPKGDTECYIGIKISKEKITNAVAEHLSKSEKEDIRNRAEEFRKQMAEDLKRYKEE